MRLILQKTAKIHHSNSFGESQLPSDHQTEEYNNPTVKWSPNWQIYYLIPHIISSLWFLHAILKIYNHKNFWCLIKPVLKRSKSTKLLNSFLPWLVAWFIVYLMQGSIYYFLHLVLRQNQEKALGGTAWTHSNVYHLVSTFKFSKLLATVNLIILLEICVAFK